ncbi:MAG: hypothetical protein IPL65_22650, partial [Lewinellaceae bacterium]|nr:hypothetical protein [Lewinellaceae bacterium]
FGFKEQYQIEFLDKNKDLIAVEIQGTSQKPNKGKGICTGKRGISLRMLPNGYSAVLTLKSFDNKILRNDYHQNFKKEIKSIFSILEEKQIKNLAIDLRDNQGGEMSNGIFLLQHIMDTPFQCVYNYYKIKNGQKVRFNEKWAKPFAPLRKHVFSGKIYVMTNGGSFSCSSIVANTIKENRRGQIIGEMTGGSAYVNSGAPNKNLVLPNTKILFTIPQNQYNLHEYRQIGSGVSLRCSNP